MSTKTDDILDKLKSITLLEASELIKQILRFISSFLILNFVFLKYMMH